jgi:hypothetical protein
MKKALLGVLKWYGEKDTPVSKNQFGKCAKL